MCSGWPGTFPSTDRRRSSSCYATPAIGTLRSLDHRSGPTKSSSFADSCPARSCGPPTGPHTRPCSPIGSSARPCRSSSSRRWRPGCPSRSPASIRFGNWRRRRAWCSRGSETLETWRERSNKCSMTGCEPRPYGRIGNGFVPLPTGRPSREPSRPWFNDRSRYVFGRGFLNVGTFQRGHERMIPLEKPRVVGATFPYVGLAVAVLALYAIVAVTIPPNLYRSAIAVAAFFAMGYCALALIAGGRLALSPAEILAFTVGLTILITSLSALAVSIVGIPITEFAVVIIGLPIGVVAFLMRRPATGPVEALVAFGGRLLDFTDYSAGERAVAIALFLAVIGALGVFISIAGVGYPDPHTAALGIDGPYGSGGTLDPLPYTFVRGTAHVIVGTVLGHRRSPLADSDHGPSDGLRECGHDGRHRRSRSTGRFRGSTVWTRPDRLRRSRLGRRARNGDPWRTFPRSPGAG